MNPLRHLYRLSDYVAALRDHPAGARCGWCGQLNTFFDDCGFICTTPTDGDTRATCEQCWNGPVGEAHIARYGLGDR